MQLAYSVYKEDWLWSTVNCVNFKMTYRSGGGVRALLD